MTRCLELVVLLPSIPGAFGAVLTSTAWTWLPRAPFFILASKTPFSLAFGGFQASQVDGIYSRFAGMVFSCCVVLVICIFNETIRQMRKSDFFKKQAQQEPWRSGLIQTTDCFLQFVHLCLGYLLMLLVMTLNLWLGLSVVVGHLVARRTLPAILRRNETRLKTTIKL